MDDIAPHPCRGRSAAHSDALLSRAQSCLHHHGSRLCSAAQRTLHRIQD